jgi:hypothetical protein
MSEKKTFEVYGTVRVGVTCNRCDAQGPEKFVIAEAIAAWNHRAEVTHD